MREGSCRKSRPLKSKWVTGLHGLLVWFWRSPSMVALQLDFLSNNPQSLSHRLNVDSEMWISWNFSRKLTMVSYSKPAKNYVSIIFFWLSTSQLPWARFAARFFPHLGQNLNETCKDCPHVEQNIVSSQLWSSQLWTQFKQLRIEAWKSQDFNGVWTRDLAIPVRRSNQLSYEATDATDVGSWSFVF